MRLVTGRPVGSQVDASTMPGLQRLVVEIAEQWLDVYCGDPQLHVRVEGREGPDIILAVLTMDGDLLKRARCSVAVTEIGEDGEDIVPDLPAGEVVFVGEPAQLGPIRRFPVINARTAAKSYRDINSIRLTHPAEFDFLLDRFMDLLLRLPADEEARLPGDLRQLAALERWRRGGR